MHADGMGKLNDRLARDRAHVQHQKRIIVHGIERLHFLGKFRVIFVGDENIVQRHDHAREVDVSVLDGQIQKGDVALVVLQ